MATSNPHVQAAQSELDKKFGEPDEGYILPNDLKAAYEHLEDGWNWQIDQLRLTLPPSGSDGDVLTTNSAGQPEWLPLPDIENELPDGGNPGEFLGIHGLGDVMWLPLPEIPDPLPEGGDEGDTLTLVGQPDGSVKPEWQTPPTADQPAGWHEIGRGEFLLSDNFVSGPQVNRPTDVGQVAGHGAINATTGPMPVYHFAETADGEGGTKLFDLAGDEFVVEEEGATDYRATATIEGKEYSVALSSSSLRVTDPDGTNVEHVPSWTFTALGVSGTAPVQVELVVEAFGGGDDGGGCFPTYGEQEAAIDGGCSGSGGGGGGGDLTDVLARLTALEARHEGALADHVPTYGVTP